VIKGHDQPPRGLNVAGAGQLATNTQILQDAINSRLPRPVRRPGLVVMCGLPGTGKTTLARWLAQRLPLAVLESDELRQTLFINRRYSRHENAQLFPAMHELVGFLLDQGRSVLLDATNLQQKHREPLYRIAEDRGKWVSVVHVVAPMDIVFHRLHQRSVEGDLIGSSEAGWSVYLRLRRTMESIGRPHVIVDTSRDTTNSLERLTEEISQKGLRLS
jgi:predicted kinase